jgi:hypothetical protein
MGFRSSTQQVKDISRKREIRFLRMWEGQESKEPQLQKEIRKAIFRKDAVSCSNNETTAKD